MGRDSKGFNEQDTFLKVVSKPIVMATYINQIEAIDSSYSIEDVGKEVVRGFGIKHPFTEHPNGDNDMLKIWARESRKEEIPKGTPEDVQISFLYNDRGCDKYSILRSVSFPNEADLSELK